MNPSTYRTTIVLIFSFLLLFTVGLAMQNVQNVATQPSQATFASLELIDYAGMSTSNIVGFITTLSTQNITWFTIRINAFNDWSRGAPSAGTVSTAKNIITEATKKNIVVYVDLHTWYTTWDNYFRDSASNRNSNRARYITFVKASITAFSGYPVGAWMVLNEPQARTASTSENNFILSIIDAAKSVTSKPVSIRFMAGYSPTTGHYSAAIDAASDYICRNTYWDPRSPGTSKYGTTEAKMNTVIASAKAAGKELWITEFGKSKSSLEGQRAYVEAFVTYANTKQIPRIFCWVAKPISGSGESYNIFNGYTPNPAFYELKNTAAPPPPPPTYQATITNTGTGNIYINGELLSPGASRNITVNDTVTVTK